MITYDDTTSIIKKHSLVMITGASGGLGKAFAVECASRGWDLYLTDLHTDPLETLANSLQNTYRVQVLTQACDLTDAEERAEFLERVKEEGLFFWGLINVAGLDYEGPFHEQSSRKIQTILRLNIEGTLGMIHGMMDFRDPLKRFHIINVASLAGFFPMPVKATYAASKRFLLDFSLALRSELKDAGATVTALCPAGLPTTDKCIESIMSQGIMGLLTTQNVSTVANQTLNAALKGKALCIPGGLNQFMRVASIFLPRTAIANLIGIRWRATRQRVMGQTS
jgi:uncharacterized protein